MSLSKTKRPYTKRRCQKQNVPIQNVVDKNKTSLYKTSLSKTNYLVVDRVPVFVVWKNELFFLQNQKVRRQFESRRLRTTLPVAHGHKTVVHSLGLKRIQVNILYILQILNAQEGSGNGIRWQILLKNSIKVAKIGDFTSFFFATLTIPKVHITIQKLQGLLHLWILNYCASMFIVGLTTLELKI
jgi:hypothetical protein